MKTLYESILDDFDEIDKNIDENVKLARVKQWLIDHELNMKDRNKKGKIDDVFRVEFKGEVANVYLQGIRFVALELDEEIPDWINIVTAEGARWFDIQIAPRTHMKTFKLKNIPNTMLRLTIMTEKVDELILDYPECQYNALTVEDISKRGLGLKSFTMPAKKTVSNFISLSGAIGLSEINFSKKIINNRQQPSTVIYPQFYKGMKI